MLMNPYRTGLVGCGKVGHTHALALTTLAEFGICRRVRSH